MSKQYPDPPATGKWRVRRWPGSKHASIWEVFEPNGDMSGAFETWPEAIEWATSIATRVHYFLLESTKGSR